MPTTRISPEGTVKRGTHVASPADNRRDASITRPAIADTSGATWKRFSRNAITLACSAGEDAPAPSCSHHAPNQVVQFVAVDDAFPWPLDRLGLHLDVWQHQQVVQSNRESRPLQPAAQRSVLQAHLRGDIPVLLPVAFEDPLGPELHATSLHLDEQKVAGLVGDHDVDLTVPFGSRRPDAPVDAVKDRERFGQPRPEAMYDVELGGQPG